MQIEEVFQNVAIPKYSLSSKQHTRHELWDTAHHFNKKGTTASATSLQFKKNILDFRDLEHLWVFVSLRGICRTQSKFYDQVSLRK